MVFYSRSESLIVEYEVYDKTPEPFICIYININTYIGQIHVHASVCDRAKEPQ